jgi:hypothetical protein
LPKALCRLHVNTSQKYIALFDEGEGERPPIDELEKSTGTPIGLRRSLAEHARAL